jgi:rhodanese-related sulfurtransferase
MINRPPAAAPTGGGPGNVGHVQPRELAERIASGTAPRLVDIREPWEWQLAHIDGAELKPLSEFHAWRAELAPDEEVVFHCHTGQRSAMLGRYLVEAEGFTKVWNLEGGIALWSLTVDPSVPQY